MTQPTIAEAMGVSLSTVNRAHMAYDDGGIKALKPKPNGGRKHENMTLAEEKALLARFANAAGAGEILNIHDLKAAYEKTIRHPLYRAQCKTGSLHHLFPLYPEFTLMQKWYKARALASLHDQLEPARSARIRGRTNAAIRNAVPERSITANGK
jgi:Winged helix-turn helix